MQVLTAKTEKFLRSSRPFLFGTWSLAGAFVAIAFFGCSAESPKGDAAGGSAENDYPLTGIVVTVNAERETLLIDHEEIPGLMPAMTMEFHVSPGDLAIASEGRRIRGMLHKRDDGFFLDHIWPAEASDDQAIESAQRNLRQDTVIRGSGAFRSIGESLPDFSLYDQDGVVVRASRFRGKQIVLNFIFTRCPDAEMCPASTAKMMQLQSAARERGIKNLELISITLDPEYDTPGILNDYARIRGIDTSNFSFLTGPESAIKDLMAQLGVLAFQEGPLVKHTLSTVLIGDDGRIVFREEGSQWKVSNFSSRLRGPDSSSN